ncbi:MAG: universal stress protein [Longimicrobiales bacterium]|nr:universal stress protein [Longimicrobiales bacterium]
MPSRVLVPVDGSNFAEHALPYALGIARRTGATLHLALVHVPAEAVSPTYPYMDAVADRDEEIREHDATYLEGLVDRLSPSGLELKPALLNGRVPAALADFVDDRQIDLVVMTTHGRGGIQRAWLGSTADSLIRHCMIPILLVRPSEETREIGPESDRRVDRVLAALDGSETAETALRDAFEIGITEDAALVLIHAVQPPVAAASPYLPHTIQLTHDEMEAREDHMRRYLERIAEADWLGGREVEVKVEVDYHPAPAILEVAEERDVDLIALGTHGRGGLRRLILGSVADKVIRGTHRPVLVHRGAGTIARLRGRIEPDDESA